MDDLVKKSGYMMLGTRLRRLGERVQHAASVVLAENGIEIPSKLTPILFALEDFGDLEIGQIAKVLGVTQPGVTRSVATLEKLGCVEIKKGAHDKRVRLVTLSETGAQIVAKGHAEVAPVLYEAFELILGDEAGKESELLRLVSLIETALDHSDLSSIVKEANS